MTSRNSGRVTSLVALLGLLTAETLLVASPVLAQPGPSPSGSTWQFLALGDSWGSGEHCGGCDTYMNMYADLIQESFGRAVEVTNLMGKYEPGRPPNTPMTDATLLESLRFNPVMRDAVRSADIILIETGGNQLDRIFSTPDCTGDLLIECINAMGRQWHANFASILDEIDLLRAGQPTAVRLVDNANPFVSNPEMVPAGLGNNFALTDGALIWELLKEALCDAADAHGAQCVDVRPIVNGPSMDQPGRDDSPAVEQVIAEALLATGLPELR